MFFKNHYSLGAVAEFLFVYVLGIQRVEERHFVIDPKITQRIKHVSGSYDSIFGKVFVDWENKDWMTEIRVSIPSNCTAAYYDGAKSIIIDAGEYHFERKMNDDL